MSNLPRTLGSGLVCLDVVMGADSPLAVAAGGSCGNVMLALAYFGWDSCPLVRLGNDPAGAAILSDFSKFAVNDEYVVMEDGCGTPIIVEHLRHEEVRTAKHSFSCTCPDCGGWFPRYRPVTRKHAAAALEETFDFYYFDRAAPGTVMIAEALHGSGRAVVMFEPAGIGDERLFDRAVAASHIVKISNERRACSDRLREQSAAHVLIETAGVDGLSVATTGSAAIRLPAFNIPDVVDTAGAGDWCSAGIAHWLWRNGKMRPDYLHEVDWHAACTYSQSIAAVSCMFEGPRGVMYRMDSHEMGRQASAILSGRSITPSGPECITPTIPDASAFCRQCGA